jgi:VWFA-related protein
MVNRSNRHKDRSVQHRRRILCAASILLPSIVMVAILPLRLSAQTTTLQVNARLVVLDIVVTDAAGHPVPGLSARDFHLTQDGREQTILTCESWVDRPATPATPVFDRLGHPDWGRVPLTIFALDELNTPFDEKAHAADMLRRYLKAQPPLLKQPATLITVNDYGYRTLQPYTRDRDRMIASLDARPPSIPAKFSTGQNAALLRKSFALLRQIALSAEGSQEHKNLIWIGRGFPGLDPASLSDKSQLSLQSAIKDTVSLLLESRITVYKIDPMPTTTQLTTTDVGASLDLSGGSGAATGSPTDFGETPLADNFNFNSFAVSTGGSYFYGLNNLDAYIDKALDDGSRFYTLSYKPPPETNGDVYRTIKVRMSRPDLIATTRQGFYESNATRKEPTADELGFDLGQAATGAMIYDGVSARVTSVKAAPAHHAINVTVQIEDRTLTWSRAETGSTSEFIVVLAGLDSKHQIVSSNAYKMHPLMAERDSSLLATGLLTVQDLADINPKMRSLRVVVRDSSGRIGTADADAGQLARAVQDAVPAQGFRRP